MTLNGVEHGLSNHPCFAFPRKCSPRPKAVVAINASVRRSISGPCDIGAKMVGTGVFPWARGLAIGI